MTVRPLRREAFAARLDLDWRSESSQDFGAAVVPERILDARGKTNTRPGGAQMADSLLENVGRWRVDKFALRRDPDHRFGAARIARHIRKNLSPPRIVPASIPKNPRRSRKRYCARPLIRWRIRMRQSGIRRSGSSRSAGPTMTDD